MIPFGITGETVRAEVVETKKDYLIGQITGFIKSSPERVSPPCAYFSSCGGCDYQHVTYQRQLLMKEDILKDMLKRVGEIEKPILTSTIASPDAFSYRTRVELFVSKKKDKARGCLGFYKKNSHTFVQIDKCLVCHPRINEVIEAINFYIDNNLNEYTEKIKIIHSVSTGKLIIKLNGKKFPRKKVDGFFNSLRKYVKGIESILLLEGSKNTALGKEYLYENIGQTKYRVHSDSFFQINNLLRDELLRLILRLCSPKKTDRFLDLYCGVGTFSIPLALRSSFVIGIEENPKAIEDARINARTSKILNASFVLGDSGKLLQSIIDDDGKINSVLINPPRSGCSNEVKSRIVKSSIIKKIVYLSCDPSTLARDICFFRKNGFELIDSHLIDLFPQTYHIETAVRLERA